MNSKQKGLVPIPRGFIETVLKEHGELLEYKFSPGTKPGDNYLSVITAIEAKVKQKESGNCETVHLLLKSLAGNANDQDFARRTNIFFKEFMMYSEVIPTLKDFQKERVHKECLSLSFAPFISGKAIDFTSNHDTLDGSSRIPNNDLLNPLECYVIMKDLRQNGFRMMDGYVGLNYDETCLAIAAYGKLHAWSWCWSSQQTNGFGQFPFLTLNFKEKKKNWEKIIFSRLDTCLKVLDATSLAYAKLTKLKDYCMDVAGYFLHSNQIEDLNYMDQFLKKPSKRGREKRDAHWKTLLHGDSWINNLMFRHNPETNKAEEVILVDLQICRVGCPTADLAYFLYTTTTPDLRRQHLKAWLHLYYITFVDVCIHFNCSVFPGFTLEELETRFHDAKLFGFIMSLIDLSAACRVQNEMDDTHVSKNDNVTKIFGSSEVDRKNEIFKAKLSVFVDEMIEHGIL